jgi:hypothetical protein
MPPATVKSDGWKPNAVASSSHVYTVPRVNAGRDLGRGPFTTNPSRRRTLATVCSPPENCSGLRGPAVGKAKPWAAPASAFESYLFPSRSTKYRRAGPNLYRSRNACCPLVVLDDCRDYGFLCQISEPHGPGSYGPVMAGSSDYGSEDPIPLLALGARLAGRGDTWAHPTHCRPSHLGTAAREAVLTAAYRDDVENTGPSSLDTDP